MEIISGETLAPLRFELYLKSADPSAAELFAKLSAGGRTDPSLCFLAQTEGREKGCLVLTLTRAGGSCVGAALICVGEDFTRKLLLDRACEVLRDRGARYITTFGARDFYVNMGWSWAPELGFIPPIPSEDYFRFWGKPLDSEAEPPLASLELPEEMLMPPTEIRVAVDSRMPEERVGRAMYEVRSRRRIAERIAIIVFIIACIALGLIMKTYSAVVAAAIGLMMLYRNIFTPRRVVNDTLAKRRENGAQGWHEWFGFADNGIFKYDLDGSHAAILFYDSIRSVYTKRDHLFICTEVRSDHASGFYVMTGEGENRQALIGLLREKAPNAVFKK